MINDYHGMILKSDSVAQMPDDMVHDLANDVELKILEAGIKPNEIAIFYESLYRQRPKVHGVSVADGINTKDFLG